MNNKMKNNKNNKKNNNKKFGISIFLFFLIFVVALSFLNFFRFNSSQVKKIEVSYTEFLGMVEKDQVKKVAIKGPSIAGILTDGTQFETYAPNDPDLISTLRKKRVDIEAYPEGSSWLISFLGGLLPFLIIIGIWIYLAKKMGAAGGKAFTFGKSRAKLVPKEKMKVTFNDVAGAREAKEELKEIIEFLKNPQKFQKLGAKIPKGIILVGPPGCGKTLLARAVAGEAGVPFFNISGSDFVEMFVGVGAARVRDLFEQGKRNAPSIVFIDELDAVGRQRFAGIGGGHDEKEQTLNQLLVELDGFDTREGVIIIGATNRPDVLDVALLRSGRFDRRITVNIPDIKEREEILALHMKGKPMAKDVDVRILARRTPGFVGADLENLVNEASLLAAREGKNKVGMKELEDAIDRVIAGPEKKSRVMSKREKKIVSYHESGHTLIGNSLPLADPIYKVSIIPRGSTALGYLKKASYLARKMVCDYGMSEKIGPISLGNNNEVFLGRDLLKEKNYSEKLAFDVDEEIHNIVRSCYQRALKILKENKDKLIQLAKRLEEKEILNKEEIEEIMGKEKDLQLLVVAGFSLRSYAP